MRPLPKLMVGTRARRSHPIDMQAPQFVELQRGVRLYLARCFKYQKRPTVTELASLAGMSLTSFSRHFKKVCGENPSVVLKRAQLRRAVTHLRRGRTVNRSGYGAGFETRRSIYRSFQRAFGRTPTETARRQID